jgi:hypothetical protein
MLSVSLTGSGTTNDSWKELYGCFVDRLSGYLMGKRFLDDDAMNDENKYHEDHVTYAVAAHARILTSSFSF